jgi:hypothetical protein
MSEESKLDYKLGQLTGQIGSLIESNKSLADSFRRLEDKFERALSAVELKIADNVQDTTTLKVKISFIGGVGGLLGGVMVTIINHFITKL